MRRFPVMADDSAPRMSLGRLTIFAALPVLVVMAISCTGSLSYFTAADTLCNVMNVGEAEEPGEPSYAVYTEDDKTLSFFCAAAEPVVGNLHNGREISVAYSDVDNAGAVVDGNRQPIGWIEDGTGLSVETVCFEDAIAPVTMEGWFKGFKMLASVTGLDAIDTSRLTSIAYMFSGCSKLENIDFSLFSAPSLTDASGLFYNCSALSSVDLSGADLTHVDSARELLYGCWGLLDINGFDRLVTANCTDIAKMFYGCSRLGSVDMSSWDKTGITNCSGLFRNCSSLTSVTGLSGWDAETIDASFMFYYCPALESLDMSAFGRAKLRNAEYMFMSCGALASLDISGLDTSEMCSAASMFNRCWSLSGIDLSSLETGSCTDFSSMFEKCSQLSSLDLSGFDTRAAQKMSYMFQGCRLLNELDLSSFQTGEVQLMDFMFEGCTSLKTIYVSDGWDTGSLESSGYMFDNCKSLVGGNGTKYVPRIDNDGRFACIDTDGREGYLTLKG